MRFVTMTHVFGTIARKWRTSEVRPSPAKKPFSAGQRPTLPSVQLDAIRLPHPRFCVAR